ncbi:hypothetical protein KYD98_14110 [Clostridium sp. YB-6]|uniref:Lipoprotein n=2 Tax=Clostridium weizhouense TaxID=2859781 RepID=A0ABS7AT13_9CLOT|nr:hypothetical protein [Clostridium weizhouense]
MKKIIGIILLVLVSSSLFFMNFSKNNPKKEFEVLTWNNYYNENNIAFFYENSDEKKIKLLESTYTVKNIIDKETSELDKVLKTTDILNSIIKYDDVADLDLKSGYDILKEKGNSKKASANNMAIIERDLLTSIGLTSRVGVFRSRNSNNNSNPEYYVVEYWSKEKNKWVMIDFLDRGYFKEEDNILSASELMNKDINKLSYTGNTKDKNYKNDLNKYLNSYTIPIDNTVKSIKSNAYITYVTNKHSVEIKLKNKFLPPTIYTEETKLLEKDPQNNKIGNDEKAYIILMKKNDLVEVANANEGKKDASKKDTIIVGAFKNGKIVDNYYLNINDGGYEKVNKYKEVEMELGQTSIDLSLDGKNLINNINLRKN